MGVEPVEHGTSQQDHGTVWPVPYLIGPISLENQAVQAKAFGLPTLRRLGSSGSSGSCENDSDFRINHINRKKQYLKQLFDSAEWESKDGKVRISSANQGMFSKFNSREANMVATSSRHGGYI